MYEFHGSVRNLITVSTSHDLKSVCLAESRIFQPCLSVPKGNAPNHHVYWLILWKLNHVKTPCVVFGSRLTRRPHEGCHSCVWDFGVMLGWGGVGWGGDVNVLSSAYSRLCYVAMWGLCWGGVGWGC